MSTSRVPAAAPGPGRREQRKHVTRRELLLAGRRLFGERGLYDPRIEDLAHAAGMAKGTLYGFLASRDVLIEAGVSAGFSELLGHAHREAQGAHSHRDVVARLSDAFRQVLAQPDIRNRMVSQGADPAFLGADEFARYLADEMPRWAEAVKASGAKLD